MSDPPTEGRQDPEPFDDTIVSGNDEAGPDELTVESAPQGEAPGSDPLMRDRVKSQLFGGADEIAVDHFKVREKLGEGGMGVVYKATDKKLGRTVALKLLRSSGSSGGSERLLREARAMARLAHPNVAGVHEVGEAAGGVYIAMEFVRGKSLREWLEGDHTWRERIAMVCQAGEGLAAAHAKKLVHRDFKPDNVMVGDDGRVRVLDFGLAKTGPEFSERLQPTDEETLASLLDLTQDGAMTGTPAYMAPEQFRMERAGPKADLFSFCSVLYQALYGQRPFRGESIQLIGLQVLQGNVLDPPSDTPVPKAVFAVIRKGLRVEQDERWADMRELLTELERVCDAPDEAPKSRVLPIAVVAVLGIGGLGTWGLLSLSDSEPTDSDGADAASSDAADTESAAPDPSE